MGAIALLGGAAIAPAQVASLPEQTVCGGALDEQAKAEVKKYAETHTAKLGNAADYAALRQARIRLTEPLKRACVKEVFRIELASHVQPALKPLVRDKSDLVAINALRISGALGTKFAAEDALSALADPREAIRSAAASAVGLSFATARSDGGALRQTQFVDVLRDFDAAVQREDHPRVLDAMVLALDDAMGPTANANMAGARERAMGVLNKTLVRLVKLPPGPNAPASRYDSVFGHGALALYNALIAEGALGNDTLKETAGVAGDIALTLSKRTDGGALSDEERQNLAAIAAQCEGIVRTAGEKLNALSKNYKLAELLSDRKDPEFRSAVATMTSDLVAAPFQLPRDRYPLRP